jgi:hypothetical protein
MSLKKWASQSLTVFVVEVINPSLSAFSVEEIRYLVESFADELVQQFVKGLGICSGHPGWVVGSFVYGIPSLPVIVEIPWGRATMTVAHMGLPLTPPVMEPSSLSDSGVIVAFNALAPHPAPW